VTDPSLLLQTDTLLAVAKPTGWVVHPVGTTAPDLLSWAGTQGLGRLRPAHRLDLETSGVVLFGRTRESTAELGGWFTEGRVAKAYLALVFDLPPDSGVIDLPLSDARRGHPLEARTRYETVERLGRFALLRLCPETGRKHQLRRHLLALGHPMVGDPEYRPRTFRKVPGYPGRLWLHAAEVRLPDGTCITAPLPPELVVHLEVLRRGAQVLPAG
jgi:23S rRNA pseudouridine955/2504/2580 synthase